MSEALNREYWVLAGRWFEGYGNGGGYWHRCPKDKSCNGDRRSTPRTCGGHWYLPALHENANLCIEELNRVIPNWSVSRYEDGHYRLFVSASSAAPKRGATFNEVALRALIAALGKVAGSD